MTEHNWREFIIDPASGDYSFSRALLGVLILVFLPAMMLMEFLGYRLSFWGQMAMITGSVAGAYGANSAMRVWRQGQFVEGRPRGPKAEPEGERD